MAEKFRSLKTFCVEVVGSIFGGSVASLILSVFTKDPWFWFIISFVILMTGAFIWLWHKYRRMVKVIFSGNKGYYYTFDPEENPQIWQEAQKSFCYLGISGDSIMEQFRRWIEKNPLQTYRILLMKPGASSLKRQEAFRIGHDLNVDIETLSPEEKQTINEKVEATSKRITSAISLIKTTRLYKEGRMKIRLYDEFSPWWMYLMDEKKAYIGILERNKSGIDSPVMIMVKGDQYANPFDAFRNHFERIWQSAQDA